MIIFRSCTKTTVYKKYTYNYNDLGGSNVLNYDKVTFATYIKYDTR